MFIINISVVRPTRKGRQDYLAEVAGRKSTEAQQPHVVDSKYYPQAPNMNPFCAPKPD